MTGYPCKRNKGWEHLYNIQINITIPKKKYTHKTHISFTFFIQSACWRRRDCFLNRKELSCIVDDLSTNSSILSPLSKTLSIFSTIIDLTCTSIPQLLLYDEKDLKWIRTQGRCGTRSYNTHYVASNKGNKASVHKYVIYIHMRTSYKLNKHPNTTKQTLHPYI